MKVNPQMGSYDPTPAEASILDELADSDLLETGSPDDDFEDDIVILDPDDSVTLDGEPEMGAPAKGIFSNLLKRGLGKPKKAKITPKTIRRASEPRSKAVAATKAGKQKLAVFKKMNALARNSEIMYSKVENATTTSDTRGKMARLRPAEVTALKNLIFSGAVNTPQIYTLALVGGNLQFNADTALATGSFFAGGVLEFEVSDLNKVRGGQVTIKMYSKSTDPTGMTPAVTKTIRISNSSNPQSVKLTEIIGAMVQGRPRLVTAVTDSTNVTFNTGFVVVGLPSGYSAKLRPFVPGDDEIESFLQIL